MYPLKESKVQLMSLALTRKIQFAFDPIKLEELAQKHHQAYVNGVPFPHAVFDDFLTEEFLDRVYWEFPKPEEASWAKHYHEDSRKLAFNDETQMGEFTWLLLAQLNSSPFVKFLEKLTGIEGLIPDPHFIGGGLHQIERAGFLNIHADFNKHEKLKLDRRLNLLLYLNKDWKEEYGGHLELWRPDTSGCEKSLLPIFNRCVIFSTTDFSFHGHPKPLNCPADQTRKSLALYYYSNGRPAEEVSPSHSTLYQKSSGKPYPIEKESRIRRFLKTLTSS